MTMFNQEETTSGAQGFLDSLKSIANEIVEYFR